MADKKVPLSIILRTVDKATAGINAVNKRLDALTKPTRDFGKALSDLGEKSGIKAVGESFGKVRDAASDLLGKVAVVGGVLAAAAVGVMRLVDQFAELGHVAARAGVEVDFLAGLRYAGEKAGLSIQQVDEGITTLTQNIGQAKSGTGRMLKFLEERVGHVFAQQIIHTNSTAEAVGLLSDAFAKLPDAARRAALAQKTFGDPAFAAAFRGGSKDIQSQMEAYAKLAPSQDDAVKNSLEVEHAMVDLHASMDGVKAVLMTGLAPALEVVIRKLTIWLVDHRSDIAQWADDIGKKIPGAIDDLVKGVKSVTKDVLDFVDAIGGWKVAALGIAAVMTGPLVAAVLTFSATLLATPFGWVLISIAAITVAIIELIKHWKEFRSISGVQDAVQQVVANPNEAFERAFKNGRFATPEEIEAQRQASRPVGDVPALPTGTVAGGTPFSPELLAAVTGALQRQGGAAIKIDIAGAPKGTRATIEPGSTAAVDMTVGHQTGGAW